MRNGWLLGGDTPSAVHLRAAEEKLNGDCSGMFLAKVCLCGVSKLKQLFTTVSGLETVKKGVESNALIKMISTSLLVVENKNVVFHHEMI